VPLVLPQPSPAYLLLLRRQVPLRRLQRCQVRRTSPLVRCANPRSCAQIIDTAAAYARRSDKHARPTSRAAACSGYLHSCMRAFLLSRDQPMRVGTCHATYPGDVRSVHITLHISNLAVEVKVSINIMREFRIIEWPLISDRCSFAYTHQMIFTNKCNSIHDRIGEGTHIYGHI
jgi:hypothetical protein